MFESGNILVVVNTSQGSISDPKFVNEYDLEGGLVHSYGLIPPPPDAEFSRDQARDIIANENSFFLFNGTFDPALAQYDVTNRTYSQRSFQGWSSINNGSYGGIARIENYIYVTDMETFGEGDTPKGILRFDILSGQATRFAENDSIIDFHDLNIGLDSRLYALDSRDVYVYDPFTLEKIREIRLEESVRGIAVDATGNIYGASFLHNSLYKFSPEGAVLQSLNVGQNVHDLNINREGVLIAGTAFSADVIVSNSNLESFTSFSSASRGKTFVAFVDNESPFNLINGDKQDNFLIGTRNDDLIRGRAGSDLIRGYTGNDSLLGNSGDDRIYAGSGLDTVRGGDGDDLIRGGSSADQIYGSSGSDTLFGGIGDDTLFGGTGKDRLIGGNGSDYLVGGNGNDTLIGAEIVASRSLFGRGEIDTLRGGSGSDLIVLGNRKSVFYVNQDDSGEEQDYALVQNFNIFQDRLQLKGNLNDYAIAIMETTQGKADVHLFYSSSEYTEEKIAQFVNISNQFALESLQIQLV